MKFRRQSRIWIRNTPNLNAVWKFGYILKVFHINLFILYFAWIPQLHNLCTRSPQEEGNKICLIAIIGFACHTYNIDIIMYNLCIADKGRRLEVKNITCHGILWFIDFFLVLSSISFRSSVRSGGSQG